MGECVVTHFALVVPFPGVAQVVDDWRERTCLSKPSHGVPPHVTLLVPCPAALDRFPGTLWLVPDPAEPFRGMTEALVAGFPEYRPYGGTFVEIVPHLTVAQSNLDDAAAELQPWLPLHSRATSAVLLEQAQVELWRAVATFDLEAA